MSNHGAFWLLSVLQGYDLVDWGNSKRIVMLWRALFLTISSLRFCRNSCVVFKF